MYDLLTRTISQGLQAFLPIAVALVWFRRAGQAAPVSGLKWGIVLALPATAVLSYWFQATSRQALWEAALAAAALPLAAWFAHRVWPGLPSSAVDVTLSRRQVYRLAFALAASLIIARQAMEITVTFAAALELRAADPLRALRIGSAVALALSALWFQIGSRLPGPALARATAVFAALFAGQLAMYAFHESAEARLLPWSDFLHAATEPYGPDGIYGRYFSAALFVLPLLAAIVMLLRSAVPDRVTENRPRLAVILQRSAVVVAVLLVVAAEFMSGVVTGGRTSSDAPAHPNPSTSYDVATLAAAPHLLFRHTAVDQNYSRLSIAPLGEGPGGRASAEVACERVSYAAGRGICLAADRGVFTTYKAVFFDGALSATHDIKLAGSPSRTRVSPDGRVGAVTVFATGAAHGYSGASFSTKTTILDMATGDTLGDLEEFTTWRNGERFKAADFNFWGVTFGRDSNIFYATLQSAGTTYLVRGELGLRKLTVLRDNTECPSLSPDNSLIAFKKRVGAGPAKWRLYVLDVATLTERPIAGETRSIDDQLEWLDDAHVLYGVRRSSQSASTDVWVAPIDNSAAPRVFLADAESPIVVR